MMKRTIFINAVVTLLIVGAALWCYNSFYSRKIVFVKLNELYEGFILKKEYESKAENTVNAKSNILDSLKLQLEISYRNLKGNSKASQEKLQEFEKLRQEYTEKQKRFEESNVQMLKSYEDQIWTQINKFIVDFGREKNYRIILGANGSGSIMYSEDAVDVTQDAMKYINTRYSGK